MFQNPMRSDSGTGLAGGKDSHFFSALCFHRIAYREILLFRKYLLENEEAGGSLDGKFPGQ